MTTTPTHLPSFRTSLSKALTTDKNAPLHDPSSSKTSLRLRKLILESPYLKKPFQGKLNEHEAKRLQKVFNLVSNLDELRLELRTKVHETNMRVNQFIRQSCFEIVEDFTSADSSDHEAQKKDGNEKIEESKRNKNFFNIFKSLRKEVRDVLLEVESEVGARFRDCEEGVRDGSIFECSKDGEGDQRMEDGDVSADRTLVNPPAVSTRVLNRADQGSTSKALKESPLPLHAERDESPTKGRGKGTTSKPSTTLENPTKPDKAVFQQDFVAERQRSEEESRKLKEELEKERSIGQELNSKIDLLKTQNQVLQKKARDGEKERETLESKTRSLESENQRLRSLFNPSKPRHLAGIGNAALQNLQPEYQTMAETSYEGLKVELTDLRSELAIAEEENSALNKRIEDLLVRNATPKSQDIDYVSRINNQSETIGELRDKLRTERADREEKEAEFEVERKEWKEFHDWWLKEKAEKDRIYQAKFKEKAEKKEKKKNLKASKIAKTTADQDILMRNASDKNDEISKPSRTTSLNSNSPPSASTPIQKLQLRPVLSPKSNTSINRSSSKANATTSNTVDSPVSISAVSSPRLSLASATRKRKNGEAPTKRDIKTIRRLQRRASGQDSTSTPSNDGDQTEGRAEKRIKITEKTKTGETENLTNNVTDKVIPRQSQKENLIATLKTSSGLEIPPVNRSALRDRSPRVSNPSSSPAEEVGRNLETRDVPPSSQNPSKRRKATSKTPAPSISTSKLNSASTSKPANKSRPLQKTGPPRPQIKRLLGDGWITPDRVKAEEAKEKKLRERFELQRRSKLSENDTTSKTSGSKPPRRVSSFGSAEEGEVGVDESRAETRKRESNVDWREEIKAKRAKEMKQLKEDPYKYKGLGRYAEQNKNAFSTNQMFEIDPKNNFGEKHAFKSVIRDKSVRKGMHAADCHCCKRWYEDVGPPPAPMGHWLSDPKLPPAKAGPSRRPRRPIAEKEGASSSAELIKEDQAEQEAIMQARRQKVSKHREFGPPDLTPPDYWTVDFPTEERAAELKRFAREGHAKERERLAAGLDKRFKRRGT